MSRDPELDEALGFSAAAPQSTVAVPREPRRSLIEQARETPRGGNVLMNLLQGALASVPTSPAELLALLSPYHLTRAAEELGTSAGEAAGRGQFGRFAVEHPFELGVTAAPLIPAARLGLEAVARRPVLGMIGFPREPGARFVSGTSPVTGPPGVPLERIARPAAVARPPGRPAEFPAVTEAELGRMSHDEIAAAAAREQAYERSAAVEVFGPVGARRYETLERRANTAADPKAADAASAEIAHMESALTPEQEQRLFGLGEAGLNAEELRAAARVSSDYLPRRVAALSDAELANDLGRALQVSHPLGRAADRIRMSRLVAEASRRGWGEPELLQATEGYARRAGIEPDDARVLVEARLRDLSAPEAAAVPPGPPVSPAALPLLPRVPAAPPPFERPPGLPPIRRTPLAELEPSTRVQQAPARLQQFVAEVERDPQYLERLQELGGGRVVTNPETIARAAAAGPMSPQELSTWPAGAAVNEVDVLRGAMAKDAVERAWIAALDRGDKVAADRAHAELVRVLPGYNNLTATGPRATQIQSVLQEDRFAGIYRQVRELQARGVPFELLRGELNRLMDEARSVERAGRVTARSFDLLRALENYATAAKLTSPATHLVNTVSNALAFYLHRLPEKAVQAGLAAVKGEPERARATMAAAFGTGTGLQSGARKLLSTLLDDAYEGQKSERAPRVTGPPGAPAPPLRRAVRLGNTFRWLSAADNFWRAILTDSELNQRALEAALREKKLDPKLDVARRTAELMNDPPPRWREAAEKVADEYTFQEKPDRFIGAVNRLRNAVPGSRFIVPFILTPYNLLKFHVQRTPLGVLSPRNLRGVAAGGLEREQALARLAIGTGLSLAAWQLVRRGQVTGAYPTDPNERAQWREEGRQEHSVQIGDRWVRYGRFQPLGSYLSDAVALNDAIERENGRAIGLAWDRMLAQSAAAWLDLPFVQGFSSLMDALEDPKHYAERFISGTVTGFVPNVLRDIRQQADVQQRRARGVVESVENMLPGVSRRLPPVVTVLGHEPRYDVSRLARASKVTSPVTESDESRFMARLGWTPAEPQPTLRLEHRTVTLSGPPLAEFQREMGRATRQAVSAFMASGPDLGTEAAREKARDRLAELVRKARAPVRDRWKREQADAELDEALAP